ncbi:hypothetical protein M514_15310 [Trichuris suis]|uniref:EF-hand domain-containing protein n=1 Tax=Trichuris suis TaxID=68888 RepID=A0A085NSM8_9BILA|nr:hypothetical protein M514_15310 [Trichuris suis]
MRLFPYGRKLRKDDDRNTKLAYSKRGPPVHVISKRNGRATCGRIGIAQRGGASAKGDDFETTAKHVSKGTIGAPHQGARHRLMGPPVEAGAGQRTPDVNGLMGNSLFNRRLNQMNLFRNAGVFTREQIEEYQDCTFFTKKDIMRLYKRFYSLSPGYVPATMQGGAAGVVAIPFEDIEKMPELKYVQIAKQLSALDFDQDGMIGHDDLEKAIRCMTREELTEEEVEFIISRIMDEADLDMSNFLSYAEFEHVVSRSPDFCRTFHVRI